MQVWLSSKSWVVVTILQRSEITTENAWIFPWRALIDTFANAQATMPLGTNSLSQMLIYCQCCCGWTHQRWILDRISPCRNIEMIWWWDQMLRVQWIGWPSPPDQPLMHPLESACGSVVLKRRPPIADSLMSMLIYTCMFLIIYRYWDEQFVRTLSAICT